MFIYDHTTSQIMKTVSKKIVSDKLKKVRTEKKTDKEFPPPKGIQKQSKITKKTSKRKSHKAIQ